MTLLAEKLYQEAIQLTEQERAALAARLIESLDLESEADVEAAWLVETERRMEELDSCTVQRIPWNQLREYLYEQQKIARER